MKRWAILFVIFIFSCATLLGANHSSNSKQEGLKISLDNGVFKINGIELILPVMSKHVKAILGKPNKVYSLKNTVSKYDEFGLTMYQSLNSELVNAFCIYFDYEDVEMLPKKMFSGSLLIDGVNVTGDLKREEAPNFFLKNNMTNEDGLLVGESNGIDFMLKFSESSGNLVYLMIYKED